MLVLVLQALGDYLDLKAWQTKSPKPLKKDHDFAYFGMVAAFPSCACSLGASPNSLCIHKAVLVCDMALDVKDKMSLQRVYGHIPR